MAHQLVSIRLPPQLLAASERITKERGYASMQEFIREAMRRQVVEEELRQLKALYGVARGKKVRKLSAAQRDTLARRLLK